MITYQGLENTITRWASEQADIRAVLVIGSRGQDNASADPYSDLDLVIFTTRPEIYEEDSDWIDALGETWLVVRNRVGRGDREWLVLFNGGVKADFLIVRAKREKGLAEMLEQSVYADVFRRGFRVLHDKSPADSSEGTHLSAPEVGTPPISAEFEMEVNRLILAVTRAAKFVRRGDLWRSQKQLNVDVKQALLVLIEWHAELMGEGDNDVWFEGRFIERWADPRVVKTLPDLFAGYDRTELCEALKATIDLAEWLSEEIARALSEPFPKPGQASALTWVRELLGE